MPLRIRECVKIQVMEGWWVLWFVEEARKYCTVGWGGSKHMPKWNLILCLTTSSMGLILRAGKGLLYMYSVPTTSRWLKIKLFSMGFMSSLCMLVLERYYEEWAWIHGRVGFGDRRRVQPACSCIGTCPGRHPSIHPRAAANDCEQNSTDHGRGEDEEADLSVASGSLPVGGTHAGAVPLPRQR